MAYKKYTMYLLMAAILPGTACSGEEKPTLANPASKNCLFEDGKVKMVKRGDGGEYGVCYFEGNRQCEEWALFYGHCPPGGLKVIGYTTPEGVYCAITGGKVSNNEKDCKLPSGKMCEAKAYYDGKCG